MIKIGILQDEISLELFAEGQAAYDKSAKLYVGMIKDEPHMFFDTADGEYGYGMIKLVDLKKVVDAAIEEKSSSCPVGVLLKDLVVKGAGTFPAKTPVYKAKNYYYIKCATSTVMVDPRETEIVHI